MFAVTRSTRVANIIFASNWAVPMLELHWTEVDGVTVVWAEAPGALRAGLLFRTGRADETLATSGHTHLIEHMAFTSMLDTLHRHNGTVDGSLTGFYTVGHPGEVSAFLANVCHALTFLPAERLEDEKRLLEAESAMRQHDFCSHLLTWRYGAAGHGLTGMAELGRNRATLEQLHEFSARRFTSGNAILWLTGPPPAELRLRLPPGTRLPLPRLAPIQDKFPSWFVDDHCGGVAAGGIVARTCASTIFADIALERLRKRLRFELALSYGPTVFYVPLDADVAHLVLYADADEARRAELAEAYGEVFAGLVEFDDAEVEDARARIRDHWSGALAPPLEYRVTGEVQRAAHDWLFDKPFAPREALESELEATTKDDVAAVGRQMHSTVMFALPGAAKLEPWCGTPVPVCTAPMVQGREAASMDAPIQRERLRYGPDGVSLVAPDGSHITVRYAQLALALHYDDGCVTLIGSDAVTLTIEPTLWRGGREICRQIRERVPEHLLFAQPARHASEIPKPSTTAWLRFLAYLRTDEAPGAAAETSSARPATCEKCGAAVIPGSVHCAKCGHLVDAPEHDPDRPLRKIFGWWLLAYGYWRFLSVLRNGVAALHSLPGTDAEPLFGGLFLFSALSLFAIVMLGLGRKWALGVFIGAELAAGILRLLSGDSTGMVFAVIAIAIMSVVSTRAKFQIA